MIDTRDINVGDQFSHWAVIGFALGNKRNGRAGRFECECDCGTIKYVWRSHLLNGDSKSCGCKRPHAKQHYKWTGCGDLDGNHWNQIVRNATGKKNRVSIGINITIEDAWALFEKQNKKCALTNISITLGKDKTASLDRIDSYKGYVHGNIQWVHKDINTMKNVFSQEYFVEMCKKVADKNS